MGPPAAVASHLVCLPACRPAACAFACWRWRRRSAHAAFCTVTAWHVLHALWHVYEIGSGRLPPSQWLASAPVFLQGAAMAAMAVPRVWLRLLGADAVACSEWRGPGGGGGGSGGDYALVDRRVRRLS